MVTPAIRPRTSPTWTRRNLLERFAASEPSAPALKIDREKGIIYGVKVLGRYSRNNHGLVEAENGSEYSPECMRASLASYEGAKVKTNHPPDRAKPGAERDVDDTFGVLRAARIESDEDGVRADLHYLKSHPLAERVLEDIERQMGVWGLSHNAVAKRERFDRATRRLVIEELAMVRSVDLVDKPATNRNLWESQEKPTVSISLRSLLESQRKRFSKNRTAWMQRLLEMYEGDPAMTAEAPAEEPSSDPDEAMWNGFSAAITAILGQYKAGELDDKSAAKKIGEYLKTHAKLSQTEDPSQVEEEEEDDGESKAKGGKEDESEMREKTESEQAELKQLREEKKARQLCESLEFKTPTQTQLAAIVGLADDKQRRELIESFKTQSPKFRTPKAAPTGGVGGGKKPRDVQESDTVDAADSLRVLLNN